MDQNNNVENERMQQAFREEAGDLLPELESTLLELDENPEDVELINRAFRALHTLKGSGAIFGFNRLSEFTHEVETAFDLVRSGKMQVTRNLLDLALEAKDQIHTLLYNPDDADQEQMDHILKSMKKIVPGQATDSSEGQSVNVEEHEPVEKQDSLGITEIYHIRFKPDPGIFATGTDPLMLVEELRELGRAHVAAHHSKIPDLENIDPEQCYVWWDIVLAAHMGRGAIDDVFVFLDEDSELSINILEPPDDSIEEYLQKLKRLIISKPDITPRDLQEAISPEKNEEYQELEDIHVETPQDDATSKMQEIYSNMEQMGYSESPPSMPESLRVNVGLLENLMNLAGELVLSRNQLMQALSENPDPATNTAGQRIDLVTSELQEAIMLTRMQSVSHVFNKFPGIVQKMSQSLGKDIELNLEGKEVELDKTIIEGLSDPLTRLVRYSADQGIEKPGERTAKGKKAQGRILLKAFHAAGQVVIEIIDDGKGIPLDTIVEQALDKGLVSDEEIRTMSRKEKARLIFLPGLSTAEQLTDDSGRGMGMDVVKNNLDRLGGQIDIDTEEDRGTSIRIKLPLTLAIIPSLLISISRERYAVPQINVDELIQIPAQQVHEKIEVVGDAQVLILRGELIPLVGLTELLKPDEKDSRSRAGAKSIEESWSEEGANSDTIAAPLEKSGSGYEGTVLEKETIEAGKWAIAGEEDINIVVVYSGAFKYGLVVDELHESVEIVVKPLGRHLKSCEAYAGATIMGDGRVALILDVAGIARLSELSSMAGTEKAQELAREHEIRKEHDLHSLFLFNNGLGERCAVPLDLVTRVDLIRAEDIEVDAGKKVIQYRGGVLPVFALHEAASVEHLELEGELVVIVFYMAGHEVGLLASPPVDVREVQAEIDDFTLKQTGISGSVVLDDNTVLMVDIFELMESLNPHWFEEREKFQSPNHDATAKNQKAGFSS